MIKNPVRLEYRDGDIYFELYGRCVCKMETNNHIYWITSPYLLPKDTLLHISEKIKELQSHDIQPSKKNIKDRIYSLVCSLFSHLYSEIFTWK